MAELWQYHVSEALMMARCGHRWYLEKVERRRAPTSTILAAGIGVDRSVGADLGHKIESGELLPVEQCQDVARDNTAATLADGFQLDDDERELGPERAKGMAIDRATRLARAHRELVAPEIEPSHVARRFVIEVPHYDYQLTGEMDIREETAAGAIIRDTKTRKGKAPDQFSARLSTQLTMYALAEYVSSGGRMPAGMALDFLVDYKKKPGRGPGKDAWENAEQRLGRRPTEGVPMVQPTNRRKADFGPLLDRFQILDEARRKEVFYPADASNPGTWWCSKKFCPHWGYCKYARNPESVAVPAGLVQITEAA